MAATGQRLRQIEGPIATPSISLSRQAAVQPPSPLSKIHSTRGQSGHRGECALDYLVVASNQEWARLTSAPKPCWILMREKCLPIVGHKATGVE